MNFDPFKCYLPEQDPVNQPQTYIRVTHDGSSCVMERAEAEDMIRDAPGVYGSEEVQMSPAQFAKLPDFGGW